MLDNFILWRFEGKRAWLWAYLWNISGILILSMLATRQISLAYGALWGAILLAVSAFVMKSRFYGFIPLMYDYVAEHRESWHYRNRIMSEVRTRKFFGLERVFENLFYGWKWKPIYWFSVLALVMILLLLLAFFFGLLSMDFAFGGVTVLFLLVIVGYYVDRKDGEQNSKVAYE